MKKVFLFIVLLVLPFAFAKDCSDPDVICDTGDITQVAQIAGGSSPPTVFYNWILPDEDGIEVGTQLYPDLSEERNDIYACIVVGDPQGRDDIQNVYLDMYHPIGTGPILPCVASAGNLCDSSGLGQPWEKSGNLFKYQVHATKLHPINDQAEILDCAGDALSAGLITQSDYDLITYNIFSQPEWYMYKVYTPMLYHQPSGIYTAKAWGTDTSSQVSLVVETEFEWISTVAIEIDFYGGVDYGLLQPSVYKVVQGNYDMVDGDGHPTVKNEGNERVELAIESTNLTGVQYQKEIDDFDVKWDPEELYGGYGQYYYAGGELVELPDPLELCQTEKIDLSVHADIGLPADTYTGTLTLYAGAYS